MTQLTSQRILAGLLATLTAASTDPLLAQADNYGPDNTARRQEATNRMQGRAHESIHLMHGRGLVIEGVGITGTRGWRVEMDEDPDAGDERVMRRELMYLERGLSEIPPDVRLKIVMLHYPPFNADLEPNAFAKLLQSHEVDVLVYGHVHTGSYLEGNVNGIEYRLVSADHVDMRPVRIA